MWSHCEGRLNLAAERYCIPPAENDTANVSSRQRGPQRGSNRRSTAGFWSDTFCDREQIGKRIETHALLLYFLNRLKAQRISEPGDASLRYEEDSTFRS